MIERLYWAQFLDRYDRPGMLFYLDPPYYGSEGYYGKDAFDRDQFAAIAERLRGLKGQFLLSINDGPEVRQIFEGLPFETAETSWTFANKVSSLKVGGVIIGAGAR